MKSMQNYPVGNDELTSTIVSAEVSKVKTFNIPVNI